MRRKTKIIIFVMLFFSMSFYGLYKLVYIKHIPALLNMPTIDTNQPTQTTFSKKILFLALYGGSEGGTLSTELHFILNLLKHGYKTSILTFEKSKFHEKLKQRGIEHYAINLSWFKKRCSWLYKLLLCVPLFLLCKLCSIDIIHGQHYPGLWSAKQVIKLHPATIVATRASPKKPPSTYFLKGVSGILAINPQAASFYQKINVQHKLGIKTIIGIPPFFDNQKFLDFAASMGKKEFFKKQFDISIDTKTPIVCMIANFPKNSLWKNHPLLLKATAKLAHERKKPIQLILAGRGPRLKHMKRLAKKLKINHLTHFVGFTPLVPEILFHSDINVLTSRQEAFGIVLMEGALMKKAQIGTNGTGMNNAIQHKKTGLLFKNNNLDDLVKKLEQLVDNKQLRSILGENSYKSALKNFLPHKSMELVEKFYHQTTFQNDTQSLKGEKWFIHKNFLPI